MNNRKINEEISNLFETCIEQFEQISSYEGRIPQIEIDIVMNNIRNIYERLLMLNKINNAEIKEVESKNVIPEKIIKPEKEEIRSFIQSEKEIKSVNKKTIAEKEFRQAERKISEPTSSVVSHMESLSQKNKSVGKVGSLFDQNSDIKEDENEIPSINEKLNKSNENSLADKLKQNKVKDLKQAIGINEKFLFINELFEGNLNDYNNAITQLNSLSSKAEADAFIDSELKVKYNWNETSKAQNIFIQLVERRFP